MEPVPTPKQCPQAVAPVGKPDVGQEPEAEAVVPEIVMYEEVRYPLVEETDSLELDMEGREGDVTGSTGVSGEPEDPGVTPVCDTYPMPDSTRLFDAEPGPRPASPTKKEGREPLV